MSILLYFSNSYFVTVDLKVSQIAAPSCSHSSRVFHSHLPPPNLTHHYLKTGLHGLAYHAGI
jgi:hypothetical protein